VHVTGVGNGPFLASFVMKAGLGLVGVTGMVEFQETVQDLLAGHGDREALAVMAVLHAMQGEQRAAVVTS
jgi:hypothetical protein